MAKLQTGIKQRLNNNCTLASISNFTPKISFICDSRNHHNLLKNNHYQPLKGLKKTQNLYIENEQNWPMLVTITISLTITIYICNESTTIFHIHHDI